MGQCLFGMPCPACHVWFIKHLTTDDTGSGGGLVQLACHGQIGGVNFHCHSLLLIFTIGD